MSNKQQTALQKLIKFTKEQIELQTIDLEYYTKIGSISLKQRYHYIIEGLQMSLNEMEKHLELEKQQIINACGVGFNDGQAYMDGQPKFQSAEQYYKDTYGE